MNSKRRRFAKRRSILTGEPKLELSEVLQTYSRKGIYELETLVNGQSGRSARPDTDRKLKISLLDAISEASPRFASWYEAYETAPSGDLSRVRIVIYDADAKPQGEVRMLVGRRAPDHYFVEDPILHAIDQAENSN